MRELCGKCHIYAQPYEITLWGNYLSTITFHFTVRTAWKTMQGLYRKCHILNSVEPLFAETVFQLTSCIIWKSMRGRMRKVTYTSHCLKKSYGETIFQPTFCFTENCLKTLRGTYEERAIYSTLAALWETNFQLTSCFTMLEVFEELCWERWGRCHILRLFESTVEKPYCS